MEASNLQELKDAAAELMRFTCNSCERRFCEEDIEEEDGRSAPSPCSAIIRMRNALSANPIRNCVHNPSGKNFEGGNAAAMREALTKISESATYALKYRHVGLDYGDLQGFIEEMGEDARAALSAPARNCDKMPDIDNLTMHDLAKSPCKSTLEYASREELLALVRWLVAPAAEREGEGNGSK